MTCPNLKVAVVRLHDAKFWCCDRIKQQLDKEDHLKYSELYLYGYKFCPYCGRKIL